MSPVLYTVGYEHHRQPESLVAALRNAGIERLLDVRELPLSRRKGFSKSALRESLEDAGIIYEHERALGNPKPFRDLYRTGRQTEGETHYRAHLLNGSRWAVDALDDSIAEVRTCLLCFETDVSDCHRAVIVEELRKRNPALMVQHL